MAPGNGKAGLTVGGAVRRVKRPRRPFKLNRKQLNRAASGALRDSEVYRCLEELSQRYGLPPQDILRIVDIPVFRLLGARAQLKPLQQLREVFEQADTAAQLVMDDTERARPRKIIKVLDRKILNLEKLIALHGPDRPQRYPTWAEEEWTQTPGELQASARKAKHFERSPILNSVVTKLYRLLAGQIPRSRVRRGSGASVVKYNAVAIRYTMDLCNFFFRTNLSRPLRPADITSRLQRAARAQR